MRLIASVAAGLVAVTPVLSAAAQDAAEASAPAKASAEAVVVQRHVDAYKARDMKAFLQTFTADAVVNYDGLEFRGYSEIRKIYSANFAPDAPRMVIHSSGQDGSNVWIQTGYVFSNGEQMCCGLSEYTVENGKITYLYVTGPR